MTPARGIVVRLRSGWLGARRSVAEASGRGRLVPGITGAIESSGGVGAARRLSRVGTGAAVPEPVGGRGRLRGTGVETFTM